MSLAICAGTPRFETPEHVGGPIVEPEVRERFHRLSDEAFDRNYLTNDGPLSRRLEEEVASRHRVKNAVFMNNATIAQLVAIRAMGVPEGEAVVAADTFISTPEICEWLGLRPVFADIDPVTLALDPDDMARKIGPQTRLVIPTHVFGVIGDMRRIVETASAKGVRVLADAAHAFDCDLDGTPPGGFGVPEFMSFHATKFFSTLEGGAVFTDDDGLAQTMREIRNFGFNRHAEVARLGTNAKASEISAAFGLASLPALGERLRLLTEIRDIYRKTLPAIPGVRIHPLDDRGRNNHRYFALFLDEHFGASRDAVYHALRRENVLVRLYFHPGCHRAAIFRDAAKPDDNPLPNVDRALGSILCLPTSFVGVEPHRGAAMIAELLADIQRQAEEVEAWWKKEETLQTQENRT